jgi:hypothetical protein
VSSRELSLALTEQERHDLASAPLTVPHSPLAQGRLYIYIIYKTARSSFNGGKDTAPSLRGALLAPLRSIA